MWLKNWLFPVLYLWVKNNKMLAEPCNLPYCKERKPSVQSPKPQTPASLRLHTALMPIFSNTASFQHFLDSFTNNLIKSTSFTTFFTRMANHTRPQACGLPIKKNREVPEHLRQNSCQNETSKMQSDTMQIFTLVYKLEKRGFFVEKGNGSDPQRSRPLHIYSERILREYIMS